MNKETEMYLIKRIEELSAHYALAEKNNDDLINKLWELQAKPTSELELKKASAFDILARFLTIIDTNTVCEPKHLLTLNVPQIELSESVAELFEELLNG